MFSVARPFAHRFQVRWSLALLLVLGSGLAPRATADDDIAPIRLVSDAAAVCVEVPHFEQTWSRLQQSRLLARLKEFPPVQRFLAGSGFQKWNQMQDHVRQATGKSLSDHLLGAYSESIVLAVYLPDGKPPEGVLIGQARDAATLKQGLQTWAKLDPQHELKSKEHLGQAYIRRAKSANSAEVIYYAVLGRTIALSDQESQIQRVIELHAAASRPVASSDAKLLAELPLFRVNRARQPQDAAAFLFLNARVWDKVVDVELRKSPEGKWIQSILQQVAAVTAAVRLDDEVVLDVAADLQGAPLAPVWRQFAAGASSDGDWNQRIPAEAIAVISSRMDIGPLIQAWLTLNPDARTEEFLRGRNVLKSLLLGRDLFTDVLPNALRDWSVSLLPAEAAVSESSPVDLLGQISLNGAQRSTDASLDRSLDNALQFGMNAFSVMLSHQRAASADPVLVKSESSAAGIERTMTGLKAWAPSYKISPQQLLLATSAQGLTRGQGVTDSTRTESRLAAHERRYFQATSQLVWLDAVRLRGILARHSNWIAGQLEPDSTAGRERVLQHLSKLSEATNVFDAAFLAVKFDEDSVRIVLGASLDRE